MILQLLFDDKFADYAIDQFAPYREEVRSVLIQEKGCPTLNYSKRSGLIEVMMCGSKEYEELVSSLAAYKAVLMHGLFARWQMDMASRLPQDVKLAWVLWGAEIYDRPDVYMSHLTPRSRALVRMRNIRLFLKGKRQQKKLVPMSLLRRVDYCLNSSPEIFEEVKAAIGNGQLKHLPYSYFTLEDLVGADLHDKKSSGHNILLGNSATITNNHFDVIRQLEKLHLPEDTKVITPLSYGSPWVKNVVLKYGKRHLGNHFMPLTDFMPRSEYNALLMSCSSFITNHHRPNAFGNVLTSMWLGTRVWCSKQNVQTHFLQNIGLPIQVIEDDMSCSANVLFSTRTDEEIASCRQRLVKYFGSEAMKNKIRNIVNELNR